MIRRPPRSTPFPYPTLFRSARRGVFRGAGLAVGGAGRSIVRTLSFFSKWLAEVVRQPALDRKSTRLNSSHTVISYAVFCLKKKTREIKPTKRGFTFTALLYG